MQETGPPQPEKSLDRSFGREAFGADPANYHAWRPNYPEAVWEALRQRANLAPGIDVLEIGAGTGLATEHLLAHQPARLVAVEPDFRLAEFLRLRLAGSRLKVLAAPFEAADLPSASFDLVVSATSFHWVDAVPSLLRVHALLRAGGAVGLWWNVFGDASRPDPFHEATMHLFKGIRTSPSTGTSGRPPYALDVEARRKDLTESGFIADAPQLVRWTLSLNPAGVRGLYATFSNVAALPPAERAHLLKSLTKIAADEFKGRVERNMTTAIYTGQRK